MSGDADPSEIITPKREGDPARAKAETGLDRVS
jgi:hypothetical protein